MRTAGSLCPGRVSVQGEGGLPDIDPLDRDPHWTETPPPWTDSQTGVKTLHSPSSAGSNNALYVQTQRNQSLCEVTGQRHFCGNVLSIMFLH